MRSKNSAIVAVLGLLSFLALPALADWDPGDPFKMHFPQLPDPTGWDVNATYPKVLADDWLCTETGPVSDVHLWVSSHQYDGPPQIQGIHLSIHTDVPDPAFSHPGELLWARDFAVPDPHIRIRQYGTGPQGWYDPNTGFWQRPDHEVFYQINITDIPEPFLQYVGTVYWLDVSFMVPPGITPVGWKTSFLHFRDDAVWGDYPNPQWRELRDPVNQQSLDMAFVITPEPASLLLLGLAVVTLRRR